MEDLFKITDHRGLTRDGTRWGPGETNRGDPLEEPLLCSRGVVHAYRTVEDAVLLHPAHAHYEGPRLWRARGTVVAANAAKVGCRELTVLEEMRLPMPTAEEHLLAALACSAVVSPFPEFAQWARAWASGADRCRDRSSRWRTSMERGVEQVDERNLPYWAALSAICAVEFFWTCRWARIDSASSIEYAIRSGVEAASVRAAMRAAVEPYLR